MKNLMLMTAVAAGLFTAMAQAAVVDFFSNPTTVNLLEKWNTDGTYGLTTSTSNGTLADSQKYKGAGDGTNNWRFSPGNNTVVARFTFDQPRKIDRLFIQWRNNDESPYNYTWSDQNGLIVSQNYFVADNQFGAGNFGNSTDTFAARTSNWIELRSTPQAVPTAPLNEVTPNGTWDVPKIGAYLTAGEALAIDGTRNIFYQENGAAPASTTGDGSAGLAATFTDHTGDVFGNPNGPGSMTWHFTQGYKFYGAYLSHMDDTFALFGAKVEASSDGTNWTTMFGPTDFTGTGYMAFTPNPGFVSWARLSWNPSGTGGGREIREFQLFAQTPEPASLALLGLGALALLRRKRS